MIDKLLNNSSYSFNIYAFPMFITAFLIVLLGLFILIQEKNLVSKSFFFLTFIAGIWQAGIGIMYIMKDTALIIPFYKIFTFFGVVAIAPSIYTLAVTSLGLFDSKKRYVAISYAIALFFYITDLATNKLVVGVKEYFWGPYITYGILSVPFLMFFCISIIRSLYMYYKCIKETEPGIKRDQTKLLLISLAIAMIAVVDFLSCYPPVEVYPFGYIPIISFISLQTYAIIRYRKASLSEIFRAMEDGIIVTDRNNRIIEINASAERITGIKKQALLGKRTMELIPLFSDRLEDHEKATAFLEKILNNASLIAEEDIGFRDPIMQLNIISSPITDRFGTISGNVIVLKDITERKRMEQELRQYKEGLETLVEIRTQELKKSEEKYKALVSHAQVGIGIHRNSRMIFANEQFISMLGFTEEEMIGIPISQLIHPDEVKLVMKRAWDRYNGKNVVDTYDLRLIRKDGGIIPAIISNAVIEYQGEKATLITIVDMTDTKLRKELEMANRELEMFAYSVSHDLRAPLRSIDGFSQALLDDYQEQLNDEGKDYLMRIRAASQRMASLINSILQLSRLDRCEMKREEIDLSALASEIIADLKMAEPDRKVELLIGENITAVGDMTLLRAVMENLLGNAWKFTQKHQNSTIEFGITDKDGKTVYFVRDNGAGFDMKYADKLFAPFQRLHSESEFSGTGIGLALVQRIIRRHGGNVWVESAVEAGTTFYFTLE